MRGRGRAGSGKGTKRLWGIARRGASRKSGIRRVRRGLLPDARAGPLPAAHDPLLRFLRAEVRARMIRRILPSRGIEVPAAIPADAPGFAESPEDEAVAAALACENERDFHARIRKP